MAFKLFDTKPNLIRYMFLSANNTVEPQVMNLIGSVRLFVMNELIRSTLQIVTFTFKKSEMWLKKNNT